MSAGTLSHHLEITPGVAGGKPRVAGSRITVQNVAVWHEYLGKTADEICAEHDITLADVHAALTYYFDHRQEIDAAIKADEEFVNELKQRTPSLLQSKLKA
jgi:uncharacterized protein (DUF433 family)